MINYTNNLQLNFPWYGGSETVYLENASNYLFTSSSNNLIYIIQDNNIKIQVPINSELKELNYIIEGKLNNKIIKININLNSVQSTTNSKEKIIKVDPVFLNLNNSSQIVTIKILTQNIDNVYSNIGTISKKSDGIYECKIQLNENLSSSKKLTQVKFNGGLAFTNIIQDKLENNNIIYYGATKSVPSSLENKYKHEISTKNFTIEINPEENTCYWIAIKDDLEIKNWINYTENNKDIVDLFSTNISYNNKKIGDYTLYYHTSPGSLTGIGDTTYVINVGEKDLQATIKKIEYINFDKPIRLQKGIEFLPSVMYGYGPYLDISDIKDPLLTRKVAQIFGGNDKIPIAFTCAIKNNNKLIECWWNGTSWEYKNNTVTNWDSIKDKPFIKLGSGLQVDNEGYLYSTNSSSITNLLLLNDVWINNLQNGNTLIYNSGEKRWENKSGVSASSGFWADLSINTTRKEDTTPIFKSISLKEKNKTVTLTYDPDLDAIISDKTIISKKDVIAYGEDINSLPSYENYANIIIQIGKDGNKYSPSNGVITLPAYPTIISTDLSGLGELAYKDTIDLSDINKFADITYWGNKINNKNEVTGNIKIDGTDNRNVTIHGSGVALHISENDRCNMGLSVRDEKDNTLKILAGVYTYGKDHEDRIDYLYYGGSQNNPTMIMKYDNDGIAKVGIGDLKDAKANELKATLDLRGDFNLNGAKLSYDKGNLLLKIDKGLNINGVIYVNTIRGFFDENLKTECQLLNHEVDKDLHKLLLGGCYDSYSLNVLIAGNSIQFTNKYGKTISEFSNNDLLLYNNKNYLQNGAWFTAKKTNSSNETRSVQFGVGQSMNFGIFSQDDEEIWYLKVDTDNKLYLNNTTNNGTRITISDGNITAPGEITAYSDVRLKNIIKNYNIKLEDIAEAPLFTYKWNNRNDNSIHLGTSALYWLSVTPELVNENDNYLSLNYATLGTVIGILLAKENIELRKRLEMLENKLNNLI